MSYFSDAEFSCSCGCGRSEMNSNFVSLLNRIREDFGKPMIISSGFRCAEHPAECRKESPGSHATGWACDVSVQGADAQRLIECALRNGITGLGVNQKGSVGRIIHLDQVHAVGTHKPFTRPTVWSN